MGGVGAKSQTAKNDSFMEKINKEVDALYRKSAAQIKGTGRTIKPSEMKGSYDLRVPDSVDRNGKLFYAIMNPRSKSNPGSITTTAKEAHAAIKSGKFLSGARAKGVLLVGVAGNGEHDGQYAYTSKGWKKLEKEISYY